MRPQLPSVGGLPFIGSLPTFVRNPVVLFQRMRARGDVVRLQIGGFEVVALQHPDHVDHVLRRHNRRYSKGGPLWDSIRTVLGNGLSVSEGDLWKTQRQLMRPAFQRRSLETLANTIVEAVDESLDWKEVGSSWSSFAIGNHIPRLAMHVVSSALMSRGTSHRRAREIRENLGYVIDHQFLMTLIQGLPKWVPFPGRRRFYQSIENLRGIIRQLISDHRRCSDRDSLLAMLISATGEETGTGMSNAQLIDEALNLYLAGYETSSSGLQWSLYFLARHPEHFARVRQEADATLGARLPRFEDLSKLRYSRWMMQEALRLYPSAWGLPRTATEDDEIGGYSIVAGTTVMPMLYAVHRHPDFWEHPEHFEPERFEPSRAAGRHPMAWCPFGAGPRKCIGQEFALMEAQFMLSILAQRYDIESLPGPPMRPRVTTALRPALDFTVRLRRRSK